MSRCREGLSRQYSQSTLDTKFSLQDEVSDLIVDKNFDIRGLSISVGRRRIGSSRARRTGGRANTLSHLAGGAAQGTARAPRRGRAPARALIRTLLALFGHGLLRPASPDQGRGQSRAQPYPVLSRLSVVSFCHPPSVEVSVLGRGRESQGTRSYHATGRPSGIVACRTLRAFSHSSVGWCDL